MRPYSLRKSRHILKGVYTWYKKRGQTLAPDLKGRVEQEMLALDQALLSRDRARASELAKPLETFASTHCKKSFFEYGWELCLALAFALVIAVVIRQMCFEPYEIPTGSMRPTFREEDRLIVSKTSFGLNVPLETTHFYFDPLLVQRTSIFIFSGDRIPGLNAKTHYFGLFPYTKRYIKRCMGKPGDAIYFYGGKIYAVDQEGTELTEFRHSPWMETVESVPFLSFNGEIVPSGERAVVFNQMDQPAGKLTLLPTGKIKGEVFNGTSFVTDNPLAQTKPHTTIETYSDIMGIRNYAMAQLLTKEQLLARKELGEMKEEGVLYLLLHHTPSLSAPTPLIEPQGRGSRVTVLGYNTVLPLQQPHLDALMNAMYTARFVVSDGLAKRYDVSEQYQFGPYSPRFPNVPNGTYEFYFGKATQIHFSGVSTDVPLDSPLYAKTAENIQKLYNCGIEFNLAYNAQTNSVTPLPHRYAYFREGDLYLLGAKIIDKNDPVLIAFHQQEAEKEKSATPLNPYVAFKDYGPPVKEGKIDTAFIRTFGLTIPKQHYLALGDNHAMSGDSRVYGLIPEDNLQGAPWITFWPPGESFGYPSQKPYPFMNLPRAIVWSLATLVGLICWIYIRWRNKQPICKAIRPVSNRP